MRSTETVASFTTVTASLPLCCSLPQMLVMLTSTVPGLQISAVMAALIVPSATASGLRMLSSEDWSVTLSVPVPAPSVSQMRLSPLLGKLFASPSRAR